MKNLAKRLVPDFLLRRMRLAWVERNRHQIIEQCAQHGRILLSPVNRVEHYFHFLFDLGLPTWLLLRELPQSVEVVIRDFGIFSDNIATMFPQRVVVEKNERRIRGVKEFPLVGMNPQFVHLNFSDVVSFKQQLCASVGIESTAKQNKVLLIERLPPNNYFREQAVKKGAGASRRSIANHDSLAAELQQLVQPPFEFKNVRLEEIPFGEQVRLFDQAALVIGQHGAGLANCLWMRPQSRVIELSHRFELKHFQVISEVLQHVHDRYKTSQSHVELDLTDFVDWLQTKSLEPILRLSTMLECK